MALTLVKRVRDGNLYPERVLTTATSGRSRICSTLSRNSPRHPKLHARRLDKHPPANPNRVKRGGGSTGRGIRISETNQRRVHVPILLCGAFVPALQAHVRRGDLGIPRGCIQYICGGPASPQYVALKGPSQADGQLSWQNL